MLVLKDEENAALWQLACDLDHERARIKNLYTSLMVRDVYATGAIRRPLNDTVWEMALAQFKEVIDDRVALNESFWPGGDHDDEDEYAEDHSDVEYSENDDIDVDVDVDMELDGVEGRLKQMSVN